MKRNKNLTRAKRQKKKQKKQMMGRSSTSRKISSGCDDVKFTVSKTGRVELTTSEEKLPKFLIKARQDVQAGRTKEAMALMNEENFEIVRQMITKDPSNIAVIYILAMTLVALDRLEDAEEWYKKIVEIKPFWAVYNELANISKKKQQYEKELEYRRKAFEGNPDNGVVLNNYGMQLVRIGRTDEGMEMLRKAVKKTAGNPVIHSNYIFFIHYLPEINRSELFEEHKKWAKQQAPATLAKTSHDNIPDPDRRLRIGYISPDFREHSVAYFFEILLDEKNHQAVENYGYSNLNSPDEVTERLKSKFDHFQNIWGVDDQKVIDMIQKDKIDILVDLAGHTGNNRLALMAYKPAPIQVTYLGCPDTTGMKQIDYRFTDELADPPESQKFYTEELVYLPDGFLSYNPPDFAPPLRPLPALKNGYITFGSFNNNCKINPLIMTIWAEILKVNENSRLIIKFRGGEDKMLQQHYFREFEKLGIGPDRIKIYGTIHRVEHLNLYNRIDIALDTFPYNGTTTTFEALWMGVPVISLVGPHHMSRVGLSILSRFGMNFLAAFTPEEYLIRATALAEKRETLAEMRKIMRKTIAGSCLCNTHKFVENVESAYRKMWHKWCKSQAVDVSSTEPKLDAPHILTEAVTCCAQSGPSVAGQGEKTEAVACCAQSGPPVAGQGEKAEAVACCAQSGPPVAGQGEKACILRRLHIGGKLRHPDWEVFNINPGSDVDHVGDAKDLSRFDDETFDELYASHVVEHFDYNGSLLEALKEWYRVLKPEGKLYISAPDMDVLCQLFRKRKELRLNGRFQVMRMMFGGHTDQYDYHYVGLDLDILTSFLGTAGFREVKQVEDFGIFKDTSLLRFAGVSISLNLIAFKNREIVKNKEANAQEIEGVELTEAGGSRNAAVLATPFTTSVPIVPNASAELEAQAPQIYPDDVMIVSYPRSGNTWVRVLLANLMSDSKEPVDLVELEDLVPDIHLVGRWDRIKSMEAGRFIKSHMPYTPDYKKVIYIIRDGRDVMISYWHYHCPRNVQVDFSEFLQTNIWPGPWHKHVQSWLDNADEISLLQVRYEDLLSEPEKQLKRMAEFSGLNVDDDKIIRSVKSSSFESLQRIETEKGHPYIKRPGYKLVRKGVTGEWKKHFGPKEKEIFKKYANPVLLKLGYIQANDW